MTESVRPDPGVPAARQALALLQALARQPGPVPAAALARDLGLPRSTTYHLLAELIAAGFVVHLPEERQLRAHRLCGDPRHARRRDPRRQRVGGERHCCVVRA